MMTNVLTETRPIRLKGRSFLAITLSPELPLEDWLQRLDALAKRSSGYFLQRPVILDLTGLDIDRDQLLDLISRLAERDVRIMGIEGGQSSISGDDLPPFINGGLPASDLDASEGTSRQMDDAKPSFMVTEPVRSGQILMSEGDITIVGSVASGAEVVAGGSIHIYGTLRGRASAGSSGNTAARIFCSRLEAELVAIAGYYQTSEDIDPSVRGHAAQLRLEGESIFAEKFN